MSSSNLPELYGALTMHQQPDAPGDATESAASVHCSNDDMLATPERTIEKCDSQSSKSVKLVDTKEYEASVPLDDELETIIAEDDLVNEEAERKAPTESVVVDIVRRLQEALLEKSPCQEDDLMGALSLSQAQLIIEEYGTVTAFADRHPAFRVVREDQLSFVFYKDHENEDACHSTSHLQEGATTIPAASYDDGARQHAEGYDDEPRRTCVSSSNSSAYESAVEEADGEQEEGSMKVGWSHVSSPPALQAVQETCDTKAQKQEWDPAVFIEMQSTLEKNEAEVAELKGRMEAHRESDDSEEQELRVKIDELFQMPPKEQTQKAAEVKNPTAIKDKPTGTNGEDDQVSPRHPLPIPGPEDKARSVPVDPLPRPQPPSDKELSKHATPPSVPDFSERPGCKEEVAASCSDVESMRPSPEEVPTKSKVAEQISKIVRMVKKKEPSCTDDEIRRLFDQVRQSRGGFSRMTFKAIVELLLDNMKAMRPQQN
ncbi:hypothetical protein HPB49_006706 [Dermacentor silvarum]|uniref:Uncharacterized protein n=1 Tax=Dermacentor silvarum TaxID=543639 RepID=A0ACB8DWP5_DERSI|nr:uncharacterized protein LOC119444720 [Dermacentor silvarum]KAH7978771.1 hypothetical protein HPB49_006706 [Dermacentor silvarum]